MGAGTYRGFLCSADVFVLGFVRCLDFYSSDPCLYVGGNYYQSANHGLFYVNYNDVSNSNANIGCRILFVLCSSSIHGTGSRAPLGEDKQIWGAG